MKKQGKAEKPVAMLVRFYKKERAAIKKEATAAGVSQANIVRRAIKSFCGIE